MFSKQKAFCQLALLNLQEPQMQKKEVGSQQLRQVGITWKKVQISRGERDSCGLGLRNFFFLMKNKKETSWQAGRRLKKQKRKNGQLTRNI